MTVDFHVHHYPSKYVEALQDKDSDLESYRRRDGRLVASWHGGVAIAVPEPEPDLASRIRLMDELGIEKQVLSISAPSVYFFSGQKGLELAREMNDALAEFVRLAPDRFEAMAALPMTDPDLALSELDRALNDLNMRGTMLLTSVVGTPLDDARFESFWARANELDLLVHIHPTVPEVPGAASDFALTLGVGYMGETSLAMARLAFAGVFERYPRIRWVFSHLGGTLPFIFHRLDSYYRQFPECSEHISQPPTEYLKRVYYDTVSTHQPALRCSAETVGVDRLIFGSDYPHIPGGPCPFLEALDGIVMSKEEREAVVSGHAHSLLSGKA